MNTLPSEPQGTAAAAPVSPPPRSRLARASLVLGILTFILFPLWPLLGGLAIALGVWSLLQRPAGGGRPVGRWLARAGILAGVVGACCSYALCSVLLEKMRFIECGVNMYAMSPFLAAYTIDHDGAFPATLSELFKDPRLAHSRIAFCPSAMAVDDSRYRASLLPGAPFDTDYDYYGAGLRNDSDLPGPSTILIADRDHAHGNKYIHVLCVDGHSEPIRATTLAEVLAQHPEFHLGTEVAKAQADRRLHPPPPPEPPSSLSPLPPNPWQLAPHP